MSLKTCSAAAMRASRIVPLLKVTALAIGLGLTSGCATAGAAEAPPSAYMPQNSYVEPSPRGYGEAGWFWGRALYAKGWRPCPKDDHRPVCLPDEHFVKQLWTVLNYFHANHELKEAFKRGFRSGYPDRIADLVLGPHVAAAAEETGRELSRGFVQAIDTFQKEWSARISQAVDVYVLLILEGAPEDQKRFLDTFITTYEPKFNQVQEMIRYRHVLCQNSEGGTPLCVGYGRNEALAVPSLPPGPLLRTLILKQTYCVMGDELGRRLGTNLIQRSDLVDIMRRAREALRMDEPKYKENLSLIYGQFMKSYPMDARALFASVLREAEIEPVTPDTESCGR